MPASLGRAVLELVTDSSKLDRGLEAAKSSTAKAIGKMRDMRPQLLGVTAVLGGMGGLAVNAASDLSESMNAVNVVFGESADIIHDFGKDSATNIGLATSAFNQMATETGALLVDTGKPIDEVAGLTNELAVRAADMASVFNTDVSEAMSAINQAIRGETEAIRRFTGDVTEATLAQFALANGIKQPVNEMTEQEKRLLRVQVLLSQTDKFAGDFANTSGGMANQMRIAKAQMTNVAAELGTTLLPIVAKGAGILNTLVSAFSGLPEPMKTGIVAIGGVTAGLAVLGLAIPPVATGLGALKTGLLQVIPALRSVSLTMRTALIASGIGALIVALGLLILHWEEVWGAVKIVWEKTVGFIQEHWKNLLFIFGGGGAFIRAILFIKDHWDEIWGTIQRIWERVTGFIKGLWESEWGWLMPGGALFKAITFIRDEWDAIWGTIQSVFTTVTGAIMTIFSAFRSTFEGIWNNYTAFLRIQWEIAWAVIRTTISTVTGVVRRIFDGFKAGFLGTWNNLVDHLRGSWSFVWEVIRGAWNHVGKPVFDTIKRVLGEIRNLADKALGPLDDIIGKGGDVLGKIGGAAGKVGGFFGLQHGGPVLAGSPYIVGERGPELFVPRQSGHVLSNRDSRELLSGVRGERSIVIHQHFHGGGNDPAEQQRQAERLMRRTAIERGFF